MTFPKKASSPSFECIRFLISEIPDPRVQGRCKYPLIEVLFIAICASAGGCESFYEMEEFGYAKEEWFKQWLELREGIPSHDTFRRVFEVLDSHVFENLFMQAVQLIQDQKEGEKNKNTDIAIDGKSLSGSGRNFNLGQRPIHLVNVYSIQEGLALGQKKSSGTGISEKEAVLECLEWLDVRGTIVSMDAANSGPQILGKIREKKGHYLAPIKSNRKDLYLELEKAFRSIPKDQQHRKLDDFSKESESNRGRFEQRCCSVMGGSKALPPELREKYPDVAQAMRISRYREIRDSRFVIQNTEPDGRTRYVLNQNPTKRMTEECVYYICSKKLSATRCLERARQHWQIENNLHWSLDVSFGEDQCQVRNRNTARNLAVLRKLVFNLIRKETSEGGLRRKRKRAGWNDEYLEKLIFSKAA